MRTEVHGGDNLGKNNLNLRVSPEGIEPSTPCLKGKCSTTELRARVTPVGFEPTIFGMKTRYPRPLDDGAKAI